MAGLDDCWGFKVREVSVQPCGVTTATHIRSVHFKWTWLKEALDEAVRVLVAIGRWRLTLCAKERRTET